MESATGAAAGGGRGGAGGRGGGNGKEVPLVSSQARGWRRQLNQRAASSAEASHSGQHGTLGNTNTPGTNLFTGWPGDAVRCEPAATGQTVCWLSTGRPKSGIILAVDS